MKKPETFDEIVHVDIIDKGKYRIISFDRNLAAASEDLADALNELVEAMKAIRLFVVDNMNTLPDSEQVRYNTLVAMNNAEEALKKAGYTE